MNDASAFLQAVRGPILLITLGSLVAIDYAGIYGFWRTWPVLIIVFGLLKLLERAAGKPAPPYPPAGSPAGTAGSSSGSNVI